MIFYILRQLEFEDRVPVTLRSLQPVDPLSNILPRTMALSNTDIPCITNQTHSFFEHCFDPSDQPALPLYIPPSCLESPPHRFHFPSAEQPLRIQIEGPLLAVQKLLPGVSWHVPHSFPLPGGPKLAELAFRAIYHRDIQPDVDGDMVVRDEYTGWLMEARPKM